MKAIARTLVLGALAACTLALSAPAMAADGANAIKYRQNVMKANGGHTAALNAIVKGEAGAPGHAAGHANAIAAIGKTIMDLFPADSATGAETAAKPEIWSNAADFRKAADEFTQASANLAKVAGGGDMKAVGDAMGALGKTCGGCHNAFRVKK